jgi:prepilin-type N-terminal cleavage/methylation domain-containing protein
MRGNAGGIFLTVRYSLLEEQRVVGMNTLHTRAERAFTLIELLIVVAIIAILASIAVPNFLEAQTRAKVAATQADMRTLATALEAYHVDNNRYPSRTASLDVFSTSFRIFPDGTVRFRDLTQLTTPISFIGAPPKDIFEKAQSDSSGIISNWDPINNVIDYYSPLLAHELANGADLVNNSTYSESIPWILVSVGPDLRVGHENNQNKIINLGQTSNLRSWRDEYDPTNGTVSGGNIYRLRTQQSAHDFMRRDQFP